jgi:predicted DNA-binding mobile mystery protein A
MENRTRRLTLEQTSNRLKSFVALLHAQNQHLGWIYTIRKAINMSLSQAGKKVGMTAQGVKALEQREKNGSITLQSLREFADALDMKLVYAIIPKEGSLQDMVDQKAEQKAAEIVNRTSTSMNLEDQGNSKTRLMKAYIEKKNELKNEMPRFLWD